MDYKISIVIRTFNEEKHIGDVLDALVKQWHSDYEIVVVDSESTDKTLSIVRSFNKPKIVKIKKKDFNYAFASNVGVKNSTGELVAFLSGHSVPVKRSYLSDINTIFQNLQIGGCYGDVVALSDGSCIEKLYNGLGFIKNKLRFTGSEAILENVIHQGIFSCSNACARKLLLNKFPFAEALGQGGEDIEFAYRIIKDGFFIAKVPDLLVKHSHGNNFRKFFSEIINWNILYKNAIKYIEANP